MAVSPTRIAKLFKQVYAEHVTRSLATYFCPIGLAPKCGGTFSKCCARSRFQTNSWPIVP